MCWFRCLSTKASSDSSGDDTDIVKWNTKASGYHILCELRNFCRGIDGYAVIFIWNSQCHLSLHVEIVLGFKVYLRIQRILGWHLLCECLVSLETQCIYPFEHNGLICTSADKIL
jgi:hypothetical protein